VSIMRQRKLKAGALAASLFTAAAVFSGAAKAETAGAGTNWFALLDRLEYQTNEGAGQLIWDGQGWYGGDYNKFWLKTEGERSLEGGGFGEVEVQGLYSRAIRPFWDVQVGVRQDIKPDNPSRTFGVIGIQGLAPYWFEVDAAAFISDDGDISARLEVEYDLLLTQRLIMQPRFETNIAIQDVALLGVGSGVNDVELGLRLRYEIKREFAPYVGVNWSRKLGETADFARANFEDPGSASLVAGIRFWF
jgi:copper resistance protein B